MNHFESFIFIKTQIVVLILMTKGGFLEGGFFQFIKIVGTMKVQLFVIVNLLAFCRLHFLKNFGVTIFIYFLGFFKAMH